MKKQKSRRVVSNAAQGKRGKTASGRALRQEELTSLREQEVELVKKQNSRRVVGNAVKGKHTFYDIRILRSGKTTRGRALRQEELISQREQEVELVKKQKWRRVVSSGTGAPRHRRMKIRMKRRRRRRMSRSRSART